MTRAWRRSPALTNLRELGLRQAAIDGQALGPFRSSVRST